jgi:hypothetical protein
VVLLGLRDSTLQYDTAAFLEILTYSRLSSNIIQCHIADLAETASLSSQKINHSVCFHTELCKGKRLKLFLVLRHHAMRTYG